MVPHRTLITLLSEATKGIAKAALASGIPVTFGVLTTDTLEQAIERAGTKAGNKGWEAAVSAIEMANLYRQIAWAEGGGMGKRRQGREAALKLLYALDMTHTDVQEMLNAAWIEEVVPDDVRDFVMTLVTGVGAQSRGNRYDDP